MFRCFMILCMCLTVISCTQKDDSQAEQLYNMATRLGQAREYDKAVEVLQKITIDHSDSPFAERAEEEISKWQDLQELLMQNQQRTIQTRFSRIHLALENYKARFLVYPLTPKDLEKLPRLRVPDWEDVWGNQILYTPTYSTPELPRHSPDGYALASFGMDGLPGGEGRNKDHFYKDGKVVPLVTVAAQ